MTLFQLANGRATRFFLSHFSLLSHLNNILSKPWTKRHKKGKFSYRRNSGGRSLLFVFLFVFPSGKKINPQNRIEIGAPRSTTTLQPSPPTMNNKMKATRQRKHCHFVIDRFIARAALCSNGNLLHVMIMSMDSWIFCRRVEIFGLM